VIRPKIVQVGYNSAVCAFTLGRTVPLSLFLLPNCGVLIRRRIRSKLEEMNFDGAFKVVSTMEGED
jgi:hypothetical protein